jgi:hypothetical protein
MSGTIIINQTPIVGGTNGYVLYDNNGVVGLEAGGGGGSLTVGTTTITGGTSGEVLTDNGGVLGNSPVNGAIVATSNMDWYVATTGNDSNPGTLAQPFLTQQRGVDQVAKYNWNFLYMGTVHNAAGTYDITAAIQLPQLTGFAYDAGGFLIAGGVLVGDNTTPSNVVISAVSGGDSNIFVSGANVGWGMSGFKLINDQSGGGGNGIDVRNNSNLDVDSIEWGQVDGYAINAFDNSFVSMAYLGNGNFTISGTTGLGFLQIANESGVSFDEGTTITISNPITYSAPFASVTVLSSLFMASPTFVNATNVTASKFLMAVNSAIVTGGGVTTLPGNSPGTYDGSCSYDAYFLGQQVSGAPTTANLEPFQWDVFKDTTQAQGLGITIKYNDAGTIYNVGGSGGGGGPPLIIF